MGCEEGGMGSVWSCEHSGSDGINGETVGLVKVRYRNGCYKKRRC